MKSILEHFYSTLSSILGFYLDSVVAYGYAVQEIDRTHQLAIREFARRGEEWSVEQLDQKKMIFGRGDPNTPEAVHLHETTQGEYKERNRAGGENRRIIGNLCAVLVYQFWEDHFRKELADAMGYEKDDVLIDSFGDLRHMRQSIIHNNGVAIPEVRQCKVFSWFEEGDLIAFSAEQFEELIRTLGQSVRDFVAANPPRESSSATDEMLA